MSIHICVYKKDDGVAEMIVRSLKHYGGISKVVVYSDKKENIRDLEELSDKFTEYEFKMLPNWSYELVSNRIANDLPAIKDGAEEVLVNFTGTTPGIAFAIRYATILSPTKTYFLDESDNLIEIDSEPIPEYYSLTNNELRILHDIGGDGKLRDDIHVVKDNGSELKIRGRNDAIKELKSKGLITFESPSVKTRGRQPNIIKRTELGETFYRLHEGRIMDILKGRVH